ncbi:hypothetical protein GCM10010497_10900 [Streptomyces cinereoruber]|uniref:DUF461 domain-containing protein n=1 Tax=Streptomyces cinereoruber TaxID=67260 RepID=A0AAV4KC29_9ACTN|nr:DUF461 domain-containing protein [Streptomyces cinereoruber]MBB4156725.1 copper(I)-binding protein [Streptomyces cinereoruber]MBY8815447.1 DUF461 domain-containing protein [Streptomyces cinereoruber]NIH60177.1 copper(I)-binding protein [Streptomyces cinereoruber]QEV34004.1 DUF461 domain-containing protein [Streptomyces cinereoruber]GGR10534.1 hypothetical protein GCM10010497_10900 [Streptomyces cinereoruber]
MSRSLRRGALAATAIVFSVAALSACGAGNDAQTLQIRPDNAAVTVDDVKIQNALVITQPTSGVKGPAAVSATVFNNGPQPQTLDAITLPGTSATVKLTPAGGSGAVTVPANGSVVIGGKGNATAVIENGTEAARLGDAQEVVFKLSRTGEVPLEAFVVPANSYFKEFGPEVVPAPPTATPSASASPSGEAEHGEDAEAGH